MPSLINFTDHVKINDIPYPKGSLNYQISDNVVSVYPVGFPERIIQQGKGIGIFSDWNNGSSNNIYQSLGELTRDLDKYLYSTIDLSEVITQLRSSNELLKDMLVYLRVISVQLEGLEEPGGNLGITELKDKVLLD